ncbi:TonB-dependent hemoglobin/transferrin/lactoferrin family receptor [Photobacterium kishitanii]|uniref:TonB-dependent hemoglobin/transferrin/lactoferrin family receptor n=1 Tax=Photobacterium kishitanii TaxID=318456 RepID=UPI000432E5EF|nr:TonB-dependent hemoglobin/transferrin/lactoferrin family receptor [Photobacterium kishitanii]PSV20709.1 TonB-dependent hemoglobin/transferrin/lactoferrin family receptor [Photobacterium kishitanii]CEO38989.1 Heme transport protein [Photobacterium kishitanii]
MNKQLTLIASSLVMAFSSPSLFAQDSVSQFDEIVVSGSRVDKTNQDQTRTVAKISSEELDEMQVNSVANAVRFIPNVSVAGGNVASNQSINIRGLEGNKVLQIIDGNRQNAQFEHRPSYFLDPSLIRDIEVVKGPISSLYGSGAIGGIVIQNTIIADDLVDNSGFGGKVKTGYQSNGNVVSTVGAIANKQNNVDWLIAGSYQDSGVMEQGNGYKLYGTEAINKTGLAKFNWQFTDSQSVGLDYRISDYNGRPPVVGSSESLEFKDNLIDRTSSDQNITFKYAYNPESKLIDSSVRIYRNDTDIKELGSGRTEKDISSITTNGFSVTNTSNLDRYQIFIGADGYEDKLDTKRPTTTAGRPVPPDGAKTRTLGGFAHVNYSLLETLDLDAGLRYDTFKSEAKGYEGNSEDAWSPSIGANWQVTEWMAWSLRYDEAFRSASTSELYMDGTHFAMGPITNVFEPNPNLKPEKAHNIELKGTFNFENILGDDELLLTASAFQNKVKDFINLDVTVPNRNDMIACMMANRGSGDGCGGTSRSDNIDNAKLQGFEVVAQYRYNRLNTLLSYGQTRGKDDKTGEWLSNIPADKWVAQVDYGIWEIDTKVGTRAIFANTQDRLPKDDKEGSYDSYELVDFYATWEPTSRLEGLTVDFTVANAFDENYRTPWTQVYEPGRSYKISAQYQF